MPNSKSSRRWLKEHFSDTYVKQAQQAGFRSRAAFKLLEIQEKDHLFKPGMIVIDLGAAPGSWSQLVSQWIKPSGKIVAFDILPMDPLEGVEFIQGDFSEEIVYQELLQHLSGIRADWVISDMAPNMSGNESVDIPRAMHLAELALDFSLKIISDKGGCIIKVFQGEGFEELVRKMREHFASVVIRKPKASRSRSREMYIVAKK
ncbi:MAG: 23S rRNA methyltransferase [Gammaproteobacteria bacterium RIFCSPHIGHO2_12_FULL_37_14]|nr:MAG: 23S rRNA methyltransferase [Gammaproteobacteria bacterium RIFCSPHIGHO2_12_FULL_37_14]